MSAPHPRRLAVVAMVACLATVAALGECPMVLSRGAEQATAHGCCGAGMTSQPPTCCDDGARPLAAGAPGTARVAAAAVTIAPLPDMIARFDPVVVVTASPPLVPLHGPPHSILRI